MAEDRTQESPPQTKVLSVGKPRQVTAADLTPSNEEFANPGNPEPESGLSQQPQVNQEPLDQPVQFTVDESEETPPEPTPESPATEPSPEDKRLQDTQRAFHESQQENKRLRDTINGFLLNQQFSAPGPQAPTQQQTLSQDFFDPKPTQEEYADPTRYVQRMIAADRYQRDQVEMQRLMTENPDWPDHLDMMQRIKAEDPYSFEGPGAFRRLLTRARERKELETLREKQREIADRSMAAGAQMQRSRTNQALVSPRGGSTGQGGAVPRTGPPQPPMEYYTKWTWEEQRQWLVDNGYYRE